MSEKTDNNVLIDNLSKGVTIVISLIYIFGFLIVNASLKKYSILDVKVLNEEYLFAGGAYALFLITYFLLGGKSIFFVKERLTTNLEKIKGEKYRKGKSWLVFIDTIFINTIYQNVLSSYLFYSIMILKGKDLKFLLYISLSFLICYTIDVNDFDLKYYIPSLVIESIIKVFGIILFFYLMRGMELIIIFSIYISLTFFINLMLDTFDRYEKTKIQVICSGIFLIISFLIVTPLFGTILYEDISYKLLRKNNKVIEVYFDKETLNLTQNKYANPLQGQVIYTSNDYLYLKIKDDIFTIPKKGIKLIKSKLK